VRSTLRRLHEGIVAGAVAQRVVDRLEIVQVHIQQDHGVAAPHQLALLLGQHHEARAGWRAPSARR
jgi:hypothetical protein